MGSDELGEAMAVVVEDGDDVIRDDLDLRGVCCFAGVLVFPEDDDVDAAVFDVEEREVRISSSLISWMPTLISSVGASAGKTKGGLAMAVRGKTDIVKEPKRNAILLPRKTMREAGRTCLFLKDVDFCSWRLIVMVCTFIKHRNFYAFQD